MSNRTAKFASIIVASFVAGVPLATGSSRAAATSDDCLITPKEATPEGSHWYYRIEHGTKRHCWYLRSESEKVSQAATPDASPDARPVTPKQAVPMQRSIANAHAELPPPGSTEPPVHIVTVRPADTAVQENDAAAAPPPSVVADAGWPNGASDMSSAAPPQSATGNVAVADTRQPVAAAAAQKRYGSRSRSAPEIRRKASPRRSRCCSPSLPARWRWPVSPPASSSDSAAARNRAQVQVAPGAIVTDSTDDCRSSRWQPPPVSVDHMAARAASACPSNRVTRGIGLARRRARARNRASRCPSARRQGGGHVIAAGTQRPSLNRLSLPNSEGVA